ncbi:MAG: hypothetical protein ACTSX7_18530 [Alphaproteobacteria bacterium]
MPNKHTLNIEVSQLSEIAHTGVRRAALFMGFGLNAAYREDFLDYELHKLPIRPGQASLPMDIIPRNLPPERVKAFKEEYATWITGCGLRELLEHYALFLDRIHDHSLFILQTKGKLDGRKPQSERKRFTQVLGVPGKLDALRDGFSIAPANPESIESLYVARNCLTHDLGVVVQKRCRSDGYLTLTWKALEFFAKGSVSGTDRPIADVVGTTMVEQTRIIMRQVLRQRKFASGARLLLSKEDLWEICYFFDVHAIPTTVRSFVEFLKVHGIPVKPAT